MVLLRCDEEKIRIGLHECDALTCNALRGSSEFLTSPNA